METGLRRRLKRLSHRLNWAMTRDLRAHFTAPSDAAPLERYLVDAYLPSFYVGADVRAFMDTPRGRQVLEDHLSYRLDFDRHEFIPWVNRIVPLSGMRVLEIGCGTGSATVAMAEQGAQVTAIDIHAEALEATRLRCELHGLAHRARFIRANADDLETLVGNDQFNFVVFFAVLEHMTAAERRRALQAAWRLLKPGQYLAIVDTPNRLWPFDSHTSDLAFFHWLPDELAFEYSRFSPRTPFNQLFHEPTEERRLQFIREGRGISYHDIELAIGPHRVMSDQEGFLSRHNPMKLLKRILMGDIRRERWLNAFAPEQSRAYFRAYLHLVIRR